MVFIYTHFIIGFQCLILQQGCVHEGEIKPIGTSWKSPDFCMEYSCDKDESTVSLRNIFC